MFLELHEIIEALNRDIPKKAKMEYSYKKLKITDDSRSLSTKSTDFFELYNNNFSPFLSKLINEEDVRLPEEYTNKINEISSKLNLGKDIKSEIKNFILKLYMHDSRKNIEISQSNENEFLIYISENGEYKNAIIDEEGDIEIMKIPIDKTKATNKIFFKEDNHNLSNIIRAFNAM